MKTPPVRPLLAHTLSLLLVRLANNTDFHTTHQLAQRGDAIAQFNLGVIMSMDKAYIRMIKPSKHGLAKPAMVAIKVAVTPITA